MGTKKPSLSWELKSSVPKVEKPGVQANDRVRSRKGGSAEHTCSTEAEGCVGGKVGKPWSPRKSLSIFQPAEGWVVKEGKSRPLEKVQGKQNPGVQPGFIGEVMGNKHSRSSWRWKGDLMTPAQGPVGMGMADFVFAFVSGAGREPVRAHVDTQISLDSNGQQGNLLIH